MKRILKLTKKDILYKSILIQKLINNTFRSGKKAKAEKKIYTNLKLWNQDCNIQIKMYKILFNTKLNENFNLILNQKNVSHFFEQFIDSHRTYILLIKKYQRKKLSNRQKKRLLQQKQSTHTPSLINNSIIEQFKIIKIIMQLITKIQIYKRKQNTNLKIDKKLLHKNWLLLKFGTFYKFLTTHINVIRFFFTHAMLHKQHTNLILQYYNQNYLNFIGKQYHNIQNRWL